MRPVPTQFDTMPSETMSAVKSNAPTKRFQMGMPASVNFGIMSKNGPENFSDASSIVETTGFMDKRKEMLSICVNKDENEVAMEQDDDICSP